MSVRDPLLFVCYSRADSDRVDPLVDTLGTQGIPCWQDRREIPVGSAFVAGIGRALHKATGILLIDTPSSRVSYWVHREIAAARRLLNSRTLACATVLRSTEVDNRVSLPANDVVSWSEDVSPLVRVLSECPSTSSGKDRHRVNVTGDPDEDPEYWLGRHEELEQLDSWWQGTRPGLWVKGVGGIGKSGLIQTWVAALQHLGYAESDTIAVTYVRARAQEGDWDATVHRTSSTSGAKSLLVVDGVDEAPSSKHDALIEGMIMETRRSPQSRVLATSRSDCPSGTVFDELVLGKVSDRFAADYLNQRGIPTEDSEKVTNAVGPHPLALNLAVAAMRQKSITADQFVDQITSSHSDQRSNTLARALDASFEGLSAEALALIQNIASTTGDDNPSRSVAGLPRPHLSQLIQLGLVNIDDVDSPRRVGIHPLVREYLWAMVRPY